MENPYLAEESDPDDQEYSTGDSFPYPLRVGVTGWTSNRFKITPEQFERILFPVDFGFGPVSQAAEYRKWRAPTLDSVLQEEQEYDSRENQPPGTEGDRQSKT